jgi:hypothetical protein
VVDAKLAPKPSMRQGGEAGSAEAQAGEPAAATPSGGVESGER